MKFKSFLRFFGGQWLRGGADSKPRRKGHRSPQRPRRAHLSLEGLEDRTLMSVLPPAQVGTQIDISGFTTAAPQIAIDPINPQKLVAVSAIPQDATQPPSPRLRISYSIDGGNTWLIFTDISTLHDEVNGGNYAVLDNPSVGFDRNENFYIVEDQHSTNISRSGANVSGAIVFHKFNFTDIAPADVFLTDPRGTVDLNPNLPTPAAIPPVDSFVGKRLYTWALQDPALNPIMAVDSNLPSFTDPTTGQTQTDPYSGEIYIAWNMNFEVEPAFDVNTGPSLSFASAPFNNGINPNIIDILASADGGDTFTTPMPVNDPTLGPTQNFSFAAGQPQLVISQGTTVAALGTPRIQGGQVNIIWTQEDVPTPTDPQLFNPDPNNPPDDVVADRITPSTVDPNSGQNIPNRGVGATFFSTGGAINEAIDGGSSPNGVDLPDIPTTTTYTMKVDITDPRFLVVSDVNVVLNLRNLHDDEMRIRLFPPAGSGIAPIMLVDNSAFNTASLRIDHGPDPATDDVSPVVQGIPVAGATDMGVLNRGVNGRPDQIGTTFDDQAMRSIITAALDDSSAPTPYTGIFAPEQEAFDGDFTGLATLSDLNGLTRDKVNSGLWTLEITDFVHEDSNDGGDPNSPLSETLFNWQLNFTSGLIHDHNVIAAGGVTLDGALASPFNLKPAVQTDRGIGPDVSVAMDNTLGSFSPFAGRLYIAYTGAAIPSIPQGLAANNDNTEVYIKASDDGGLTWDALNKDFLPVRVNNDHSFQDDIRNLPQDGFSGANDDLSNDPQAGRAQFEPSIAVDQTTGTLVATYYDSRFDAARSRVARMITTSIDGGETYGTETFLNPSVTATNAVTGQTVDLGPLPDNQSPGNAGRDIAQGFGDRQGLAVNQGRVYAVWSANTNVATAPQIFTALTRIGVGPRIIESDMGPVLADASTPDGSILYNNTFAVDGTRRPTGFMVTFDRPVDPASFTPANVTVAYRKPDTSGTLPPDALLDVKSVTPLDAGPYGPNQVGGIDPDTGKPVLATQFLVLFDPSNALTVAGTYTGTYSYAIGQNVVTDGFVQDLIRAPILTSSPDTTATFNPPADQINLRIPPTGTTGETTSTLSVGGYDSSQVITHLAVTVSIHHSFDSDLTITLRHTYPNGTFVDLLLTSGVGGSGADYNTTTFDDNAALPIFAGTPPFNGTFQPFSLLSVLNGTTPDGTWELIIDDGSLRDTGVLDRWSLQVTTGILTQSFQTGNSMDQNADGFTGVVAGDTYAVPTPMNPKSSYDVNNGFFKPPFDPHTLPLIVPGPHTVRPTFSFDANTLDPTQVNLPVPPTGTGGSGDPAQDTTVSTILVKASDIPADQVISDLTVNLQLAHASDQDLKITLTAPDGTLILLSNHEGGATQNYTNTTFDDSSLIGINDPPAGTFDFNINDQFGRAKGPFSGHFRPETPLSALDGKSAAGVWTLRIEDDEVNAVGTLNDWSLHFTTADNVILDNTTNTVDVHFDRDINAATFDGTDVVSLSGPSGIITNHVYPQLVGGAIPDAPVTGAPTPLMSTITVPDSFTIADLNVQLDITHTRDADLRVMLQAPDGTQVQLFSGVGGSGQNFQNTLFDDSATTPITAGTAPFAGTFKTIVPLSTFNGKNAQGVWTLIVTDGTRGNVGTLNSWSLIMSPFSVKVSPNNADPAHPRTFQITFPMQQLSGNYALVLSPNITSTNGEAIDANYNAGMSSVRGAVPTAVPPAPVRYVSSNVGQTLAPQQTTISTLTVPDNFQIQGATVSLDITDSNDPDLTVVLVAPDGTRVQLFSGVGASGNRQNFSNTTFNDDASKQIAAGVPPFTGQFIPQQPLGVLKGLLSAGTWQLQITNTGPLNVGKLNSWSLTLQKPLAETLAKFTATAPAVPLAIPTQKTVTSSIQVSDDFVVSAFTVQLNITPGPSSPNLDPNLSASLVFNPADGSAPVTIQLFTKVGRNGGTQGFSNTVFDDAALTPIQLGSQPFFGRFNPQQALSAVAGHNLRSGGTWNLVLKNDSSTDTGTLTSWSLTFEKPAALSGLGEPLADQSTVPFRVFTFDPTNPQSHTTWTQVGPTGINNSSSTGKIGAIAVDPSDPSGNTVYVGAASGGVWKTTNFLTTNSEGPTWIPLTDFGPTFGVNIGSIAVFARNGDPNQSIIVAGTGDGPNGFLGEGVTEPNTNPASDIGPRTSFGVGFLLSMDGGAHWTVEDSTDNTLPEAQRDHAFLATSVMKVVVDPHHASTGPSDVIIYAAVSDVTTTGNFAGAAIRSGGIWRSIDSGLHWTRLRTGQATDVLLDPTSGTVDAITNPSGNLLGVYAAFSLDNQSVGQTGSILYSANQGDGFQILQGGIGDPLIQNGDPFNRLTPIPVANQPASPNQNAGRILLAKPALTGIPVEDIQYADWLYALVLSPTGTLAGLYMTKDNGQNWTLAHIPVVGSDTPTNDATQPTVNVFQGANPGNVTPAGNNDVSFAIDPTNPNIVYMGGNLNGPARSFIRVDTTAISDAHAFFLSNDRNDGGLPSIGTIAHPTPTTSDPALVKPPLTPLASGIPNVATTPFLSLVRDPSQPFLANATVLVSNIQSFANSGSGVTWQAFDGLLQPIPFTLDPTQSRRADKAQQLVTIVDPVTGHSRLIVATAQGIYTGVDMGDGSFDTGVGSSTEPMGTRNGNLQTTQFFYGAVQPSDIAAQISGALFYGSAVDNGFPQSGPNPLSTGDLGWTGPRGDGGGIVVSQSDDGTGRNVGNVYRYVWPSSLQPAYRNDLTGYSTTDFFQVNGVGRTQGLLQASGPSPTPDPQWTYRGGSNIAINPLTGDELLISSSTGQVFATANQGVRWVSITTSASGAFSTLDGTMAQALAYGAPDPNAPGGVGQLNKFVYAGTQAGRIFVSSVGGGAVAGNNAAWTNISAGLDGSPIMAIVTNPNRGSHEAYAVTQNGVYHMTNSLAPNATWSNITSNIFRLTQSAFGDPNLPDTLNFYQQSGVQTQYLTGVVADWRFMIPDNPAEIQNPAVPPALPGPTHPILYASGQGGVYRSLDNGSTWTRYPTQSDDPTNTPAEGGLPNVNVHDLDVSLGTINPVTGRPLTSTGPDLIVATTYGRGMFALRLAPVVLTPSLRLDPNLPAPSGSDSGPNKTDNVTNVVQPFIDGLSEITAFGNSTRIELVNRSVTVSGAPADTTFGQVIGTGTTDQFGRFQIQINANAFDVAGLKTIGVRAVDTSADGQVVGSEANFTFTLDLTPSIHTGAADALHLDATQPVPPGTSDSGIVGVAATFTDKITSVNTPVIDGFVDQAAPSTIQVFNRTVGDATNGQVIGTATANADGSFSVRVTNPLTDGRKTVGLKASLNGQTSTEVTFTFIVDTTAPAKLAAAPALSAASDSGLSQTDHVTKINAPTFTGQGEFNAAENAGALIQLFARDTSSSSNQPFLVGDAFVQANGTYSVTVGSFVENPVPSTVVSLPDGTYEITATQEDVAGNVGVPSDFLAPRVVIVTVPPAPLAVAPTLDPSTDTGTVGDDITSNNQPLFTGTGPTPGTVVEILSDGLLVGSAVATASGYAVTVGTYTPSAQGGATKLADGTHSITAVQLDVAGNMSGPSPAVAVTIDTVAPPKPVIKLDPASDSGTLGDFVTSITPQLFDLSNLEMGATVQIKDSGTVIDTFPQTTGTTAQRTLNLANGTHLLTVTVTSPGGKVSTSAPLSVTIITPLGTPSLTLDAAYDSGTLGDNVTAAQPLVVDVKADLTTSTQTINITISDGGVVIDQFMMPVKFPTVNGVPRTLNLATGSHPLKVTEENVVNGNVVDTATSSPVTITVDPNNLNNDQKYVRYVYSTILGRPGTLPEWNFWANNVINNPALGSSSRFTFTFDIEHSQEARTRLVESWYLTYLGHSATVNGTFTGKFWVDLMVKSGLTEENTLRGILGSPEYFNRAPTIAGFAGSAPSNQLFVLALYTQLLEHSPGSSEVNYWVSQIANVGRSGVAYFLMLSPEHRDRQIKDYYANLLKRPGDANGINFWVTSGIDLGTIRAIFEASTDFYNIAIQFSPP